MINKKVDLIINNFSKKRVKISIPFTSWGKNKVYIDDIEIKKNNGVFTIFDDQNIKHILVIKRKFLDPIPVIYIDDKEHFFLSEHINAIPKIISIIPFFINMLLMGINIVTIIVPLIFIKVIINTFYKHKNEKLVYSYVIFYITLTVPICYYTINTIFHFLK